MKSSTAKLTFISIIASIVALTFDTAAFAHVVVKPAEVQTAGFQTFTVGVPNEKDTATTKLKLLMPAGLQHVSPTVKNGWTIDIEKSGNGANTTVRSITWRGGTIGVGLRDDFTFSAQVPAKASELQWKAYQTYADGTTVAWDRAASNVEHDTTNSGPFSVSKVVSETTQQGAIKTAERAAADAKVTAERALYIAIASVVLGLSAVYLATRKRA